MSYKLIHVGSQDEWDNLPVPEETIVMPLTPETGILYQGWQPEIKLNKKLKNWIKRLNGENQTCYYCCAAELVDSYEDKKDALEYRILFRFSDIRHAVLFKLTFA